MRLVSKGVAMIVTRNQQLFESTRKKKGSTMKFKSDSFIERLRGPMNQDVLEELAKRNQARVKKIIAEMGEKWIGHPSRRTQRKEDAAA
jgi:hypothetical protein